MILNELTCTPTPKIGDTVRFTLDEIIDFNDYYNATLYIGEVTDLGENYLIVKCGNFIVRAHKELFEL